MTITAEGCENRKTLKMDKEKETGKTRILAIDSSGLTASVAVVEEGCLLAEYTIHHKKTHSQTLVPMMDEVKRMLELELDSLDAIAVASGPGSFTGLRIGSATAKGLAMALGLPIVEVPTLEGLAWQMYGTDKRICPLMDARRGQVYTGLYEFAATAGGTGYELRVIREQCTVAIEDILRECSASGREVIFLGDGVPVYAARLAELMKVPYTLAPAHRSRQSAAAVGAYAICLYRQGRCVSAAEHKPEYLRLSQAEREKLEKEKTEGERA